MSNLFRREAMARRSRALYGEVRLRAPLPGWVVAALVLAALGVMAFILFGVDVGGQSVWSWLRG